MKFTRQYDTMDCGPTCLKMVSDHYGKSFSLEYLREMCFLNKQGVSMLSLNDAAEKLGFRTLMVKLTYERLAQDCPLPCILHWNQEHFVVLSDIKEAKPFRLFRGNTGPKITVADPAHGIFEVDNQTFLKSWISTVDEKGTALLLEPTPVFYENDTAKVDRKGYAFLLKYLIPYKKNLAQLVLGMLVASIFSLAFPILTQLLVDEGINGRNISVVYLVLLSQLLLFVGGVVIDVVRSWLLLHMNTRISLSIISDFLTKLLRLPISYFDTKAVGDLSQRINDHHRIENFLTGDILSSFFSVVNIAVFTLVLAYYNWAIVFVFLLSSAIGLAWVLLFQKRRKQLDYKRFTRNKENQDKLYEMITGMQEIKLFGSETTKRWEWEQLQIKSFRLNIKSLALDQYQQIGFRFFTHLKNILISFIAAKATIAGHISLGELLGVSYIIGQTNGPIEQLITFFKSAQDARLSMDRLQEIHNKEEEEANPHITFDEKITCEEIKISGLSYQYEGPRSPWVLEDIDLMIPKGKITAVVGTSGSGKTTLLKLLMGFYSPTRGEILIGGRPLESISPKAWRNSCGSVMQEGFIFNDTIARNIALDGQDINPQQLEDAVTASNLTEFIESLPSKYITKIGSSGMGISGGQKQRILIARSVYKNPDFLFFDEATSSLDANNEKSIMENLKEVFQGKTVLIIAHRLSTVKNADQIIVLEKGKIVEKGNHQTLTQGRGQYYQLVKNQLELGS